MTNAIPKKLSSFFKKEIEILFKKAFVKVRYPGLRILVSPRDSQQAYAKLLLIVPKKVGNAPQRNLIKRRLRSVFYQHSLYLNTHHFIIFTDNRTLSIPFQTLETVFKKALEKK